MLFPKNLAQEMNSKLTSFSTHSKTTSNSNHKQTGNPRSTRTNSTSSNQKTRPGHLAKIRRTRSSRVSCKRVSTWLTIFLTTAVQWTKSVSICSKIQCASLATVSCWIALIRILSLFWLILVRPVEINLDWFRAEVFIKLRKFRLWKFRRCPRFKAICLWWLSQKNRSSFLTCRDRSSESRKGKYQI